MLCVVVVVGMAVEGNEWQWMAIYDWSKAELRVVTFGENENLHFVRQDMNGWRESQRFHLLNQSVSCLTFDRYNDLLWSGSTNGQVSSFLNGIPPVRYTSFPCHPDSANQILVMENVVYSVGQSNVKCTNKRGISQWNKMYWGWFTCRLKNGSSMCTTSMSSELAVASTDGFFHLLNMTRGVVLKQVSDTI